MKRILFAALLLVAPAVASADELDKYVEVLRSDLQTGKTALLTEALSLTTEEGNVFWPIQREYEVELAKIADQRIQLIRDYAGQYNSMTGDFAKSLMDRAFKLDESRTALLKKYTGKVSKQVSPIVAARFAQCESLVNSMVDVKLRSELPLLK